MTHQRSQPPFLRFLRHLWSRRLFRMSVVGTLAVGNAIALSAAARNAWESYLTLTFSIQPTLSQLQTSLNTDPALEVLAAGNGRPKLSFLPKPEEVWECEVAVVGGSLGGVAAASHAMQAGATTCLIELSPWMGGQISSQGVSAIDESKAMRAAQNFSQSWLEFKWLIKQQWVRLPAWTNIKAPLRVSELNSCWVGHLCFSPQAGATAAQEWLEFRSHNAPESRWATATAFKGAEFDPSGKHITAIYAVRRVPRASNYVPEGRFSQELASWYAWSDNAVFEKIPIRLQPPPGKQMLVIDATDTGELVAWAKIPYHIGSDPKSLTGEASAHPKGNPECTQAFTFPFVLAIHDDQGASRKALSQLQPGYSRTEHRKEFHFEDFPLFHGGSLFNYRRIVSTTLSDPRHGSPAWGDMTIVNWNRGNDWYWMNPPLILSADQLTASGHYENWMGGLAVDALREAEYHALLFSEWLMEDPTHPEFPLAHLSGPDSPIGTRSGLSMQPYIREGRRILGRAAYGQEEFMIREADVRVDMPDGRDFSQTAVALTHYGVDIHGCRYRNWEPTGEASSASVEEYLVQPVIIPLEALIPQGIDNVLIGGKGIAVTHIANAVTRVHYGEWSIGAAAGATAGWLVTRQQGSLLPPDIVPESRISQLQQYLKEQGLRFSW